MWRAGRRGSSGRRLQHGTGGRTRRRVVAPARGIGAVLGVVADIEVGAGGVNWVTAQLHLVRSCGETALVRAMELAGEGAPVRTVCAESRTAEVGLLLAEGAHNIDGSHPR